MDEVITPLRLDATNVVNDMKVQCPTKGYMSGHIAAINTHWFQTNKLVVKGVQTRESEFDRGKSSSIVIHVNPESLFQTWLSLVDDRIFSETIQQWDGWFGSDSSKPCRDDFVSNSYIDEEGNQYFRFYPGTSRGYQTVFYDQHGNPLLLADALQLLDCHSKLSMIITCCGVWMSNKRFGVRFKVSQVKIYPDG